MFREMGVGHGDRVCLFMPNAIEYLYCWFGLSELGAISVPINTAYRRRRDRLHPEQRRGRGAGH